MSTDPARRVLDAAIAVARQAPARRGTYVSHAKIYWPAIEELCAALDALGIEWRTGKAPPNDLGGQDPHPRYGADQNALDNEQEN